MLNLNSPDIKTFFDEQGVAPLTFETFTKGHSELGSLVEVCVKAVKKLIYTSIKNNVLDYFQFEFLISKVVHIINRRPIALKETLRDKDCDVPEIITPEHLIKGRSLVSLNIIPSHNSSECFSDPDFSLDSSPENILQNFEKLQRTFVYLKEKYHSEFLSTLLHQAVNSA